MHETDPRMAANPTEEGKRIGILLWEHFSKYKSPLVRDSMFDYFKKIFTDDSKYADPYYKSAFAFEAWHYFAKLENDAVGESTFRYDDNIIEEFGVVQEESRGNWRRFEHEGVRSKWEPIEEL